MTITELHKILHPKLAPYSGDGHSYRHRLGADMFVLIERCSDNKWSLFLYERGQKVQENTYNSESKACEEVLKIASE
jgi:hypothetical protein